MAVQQARGLASALICGNMPGCERMAASWGRAFLIPGAVTVIETIMPVERARHFLDHSPQALILFASGSPANEVLRNKFAARLLPIIEVDI